MRKILALEGRSNGGMGRLSLEDASEAEVAAVEGEARADAEQVAADIEEATRGAEVSDGLEDLAVIGDQINASADDAGVDVAPETVALIENSAQMAVAGTDIAPEEIINPEVIATESRGMRRIATEGLRETARNIWENIKRIVKDVWKRIEAFFHKYFGLIPRKIKAIQAMRAKVEDLSGKKIRDNEKNVTVSTGVGTFTVANKQMKNGGELKAAMKNWEKLAEETFESYPKELKKVGETLADYIGDFDSENPQDSALKLIKGLSGQFKFNSFTVSGSSRKGYEDMTVKETVAQLTNQTLLVRFPAKANPDHGKVLGLLEVFRRAGAEYVDSVDSNTKKDLPSDFEFQIPTPAVMLELLDSAESILEKVEKYDRGNGSKDIKKAQERLEKASESAAKSEARGSKSNEASEQAVVPYYRSMLNFNTAYARWCNNPLVATSTKSMEIVNAVMALVSKCAAMYER